MDFKKIGVVVGAVLIIVGIFFMLNGGITGNVAWEPIVANNCTDTDIKTLWSEIFDEPFNDDNGEILKSFNETTGDCYYFAARAGDSVNYIAWTIVTYLENEGFIAYYIDGNEALYNNLMAPLANDNPMMIHPVFGAGMSNLDNIDDNLMADQSVAVAYFNSIATEDVSSLTLDVYQELPVYMTTKEETVDGELYTTSSYVGVNESIVLIKIVGNDPEVTGVTFSGEIDDFTFEWNTTDNDAFDLDDYFDNIGASSVISFEYVANNQVVGNVTDDNNVEFTPTKGFLGSEIIYISVDSVWSNTFNVTIVEDLNDAPVLIKDFESVDIVRGTSKKLYMDVYFEDPEDDNMTYSASGETGNLTISFSGDTMNINLKDSFNKNAEIYVTASDGEFSKRSNKFWVFENMLVAGVVNNTAGNSSDDNSSTSGSSSGTSGNSSTSTENSTSDKNENKEPFNLGWVIWVVVILVFVLLILFAIWFFILRKGDDAMVNDAPGLPPGDASSGSGELVAPAAPVNSVDEYMNSLNLNK